jgi:hypothetical protein
MAVHSNCPKCHQQVLVPEGAGDAVVRCPLCHEEYELSEAHALLAPALIIVRHGASVAMAGSAAAVHANGGLLQEREHIVPVTIGHDEADDFKFSEDAHSPFHAEPIGSGTDNGTHVDDIVTFDPEHAFETVGEEPDEGHHGESAFGADMFAEHQAHGDHHGENGVETLAEPTLHDGEAVDPWNASSWHDQGDHAAADGHAHAFDHSHEEEIAVAEDETLSAVDFASITGKSASPGVETEGAPVPAKRKKRRRESGGGLGRVIGIVVSGLLAVPCVGVLGAVFGAKTDVFGMRPYMQKVPYVNKLVGGPAPVKAAALPVTKPSTAASNGPAPIVAKVSESSTSQPNAGQTQPAPNTADGTQPNKPFDPNEGKTAPKNKPSEKKPDDALADAGTPKKPDDKGHAGPAKASGKENGDAIDPTEPKVPGAGTPDEKPDDVKPDDPFGTPIKPGVKDPMPEIKPIAPGGIGGLKPSDIPGIPKDKPSDKPEIAPKENPDDKPAVTPPAKPATGDDPFSTADDKSPKPEMIPDPKPELPKTDEVPAKPDLKTEPKIETPKVETPIPEPKVEPVPEPKVPEAKVPQPSVTEPKPTEPKPIVEPVLGVVPKQAPAFDTKSFAQAISSTTVPADVTPASYGDLCKLAEMATYVRGGGEAEKQSLATLLTKVSADPKASGKLAAMAKSRLEDPASSGGILLAGSVMVSKNKGELWGTAIKVEGQAAPVMVFSSHDLNLKGEERVLVPGAIVRDPAKNLPGYTGKQPVIVWADAAVKLP